MAESKSKSNKTIVAVAGLEVIKDDSIPSLMRNLAGLLTKDPKTLKRLGRVAAGRPLKSHEIVEFDLDLETVGRLIAKMADWGEKSLEIERYKQTEVQVLEQLLKLASDVPSENARKGGLAKLEKNPAAREKAAAIAESKVLWQERETGKHKKLRTEDQFAMEVAKRWPVIASISAIKKRSSRWRREAKK